MTSINEMFSAVPLYDETGLVTGSAAAVRFASGTAKLVRFVAYGANIGPFYIGSDPSRMYYEIASGADTGWIPIHLMERLWFQSASGTSERLAYWLQR